MTPCFRQNLASPGLQWALRLLQNLNPLHHGFQALSINGLQPTKRVQSAQPPETLSEAQINTVKLIQDMHR